MHLKIAVYEVGSLTPKQIVASDCGTLLCEVSTKILWFYCFYIFLTLSFFYSLFHVDKKNQATIYMIWYIYISYDIYDKCIKDSGTWNTFFS